MADILLTTLNAKYPHTAFGLRYLLANLGALQERAALCEFTIHERPADIVEKILSYEPTIVGLGVYIWNAALALEVAQFLKAVRPDITLVLGGPEVSHETAEQALCRLADYVVCGEGEVSFARLCQEILAGAPPQQKILSGQLPDVAQMALPYHLYNDEDVQKRVVYVEASRGCPFQCEFCLSSLDQKVRRFPLDEFLGAMQTLVDRGVQHFKFIDRTFNLNIDSSKAILTFFLERYRPGMFVHFEMIPDRLPDDLRDIIARFPQGALQFEVGIQTFNPEVSRLISRRQNVARLEDNLRFLRSDTGVHVHADLIVGLPGESLESFAQGFDRLVALGPQEIQVGILKRLRGTPIARHTQRYGMVYSPHPPYEILQNDILDFKAIQRMKRFARFWDMVVNSGNFVTTAPLLWRDGSPFAAFMEFSDWLFASTQRTHAIALPRLAELLFAYLSEQRAMDAVVVAGSLGEDFVRVPNRHPPSFLAPYLETKDLRARPPSQGSNIPRRQARHLN